MMSSFQPLAIIDSDSMDRLDHLGQTKPELFFGRAGNLLDLAALGAEIEISLIDSPYIFDADAKVMLPMGSGWEKNKDRENSQIIYSAFENFWPSDATDRRIWLTLALSKFVEYTQVRWFANASTPERRASSLKNHVLAWNTRSRWRDQSISRLWSVADFVENGVDHELLLAEHALGVLMRNSELYASLLGRSRTASSDVLSAIFIKEVAARSRNADVPRELLRDVLKEIDLQMGRRNLLTLDKDTLSDLVREWFTKFEK
jgi:Family of unknown function (DUF6339)